MLGKLYERLRRLSTGRSPSVATSPSSQYGQPDAILMEILAENARRYPEAPTERTLWDQIRDRQQASEDPVVRKRFLLGLDPKTNQPQFLRRDVLDKSHAHITGTTGSAKTSASLMPLLIQLIRGYRRDPSGDPADAQVEVDPAGFTRAPPIVVIDLKGDNALFHTVKTEAEIRGQKFRFLSIEETDDSDFFDPFQGVASRRHSPVQLANYYVEAFNLDYGLFYGAHYYTQENTSELLRALKRLLAQPAPTLKALQSLLSSVTTHDSKQIRHCVEFLAEYRQLDPQQYLGGPDRAVDMRRLLENGEVAYFYLPTLGGLITGRPLAGLALYSLVIAAKDLAQEGNPRKSYVFIDEFQTIAGKALADVLAQARGFGVSLILANQSKAQLKNPQVDLAQEIETNSGFKQYYTILPDEMENILQMSADHLKWVKSYTEGSNQGAKSGPVFSETYTETWVPQLEKNGSSD